MSGAAPSPVKRWEMLDIIPTLEYGLKHDDECAQSLLLVTEVPVAMRSVKHDKYHQSITVV